MKRILVPTDFSSDASNAVKFAYLISKENGYKFSLLNVYNFAVYDPNMPPEILSDVIKQSSENSAAGLELLADEFENTYPEFKNFLEDKITAEGNTIEAIENAAEEGKFDFIVMGTKGASGLEEVLIGSNAYSVLAKSKIPVLVIPEKAEYNGFQNILYAVDLTGSELPAVKKAEELLNFEKSDLTFLHLSGELEDDLTNDEKVFFDELRNEMKNISCKFEFAKCVEIAHCVEELLKKLKSDLLIVSKKKRDFLGNLFHKSVSKKLACHTDVPLLALHK
ncbi:MAG: universal stress protein [Bacteroidetes bacterium]|nr:universal stress protein [Bacteroidota bacterium]